MIQFLALSLLFSFIEAKGWGFGGSSHSYHSYGGRGYNGNYHAHHTHTYHGGSSGGTINGLYALLVFVAVFLLVCLVICLIQKCRQRSDGTWHLALDSSSSSSSSGSSSSDSDCESANKRVVVRKRPTYDPIPYAAPQVTGAQTTAVPAVPVASAVNGNKAVASAPTAVATKVPVRVQPRVQSRVHENSIRYSAQGRARDKQRKEIVRPGPFSAFAKGFVNELDKGLENAIDSAIHNAFDEKKSKK